MSSDPTTPDGDRSEVVVPLRPSMPSSEDVSAYLPPNDAAAEARQLEALAAPKGVPSPELVARLKQLNDAEEAAFTGTPSPWVNGGGAAGLDKTALPSATRPIEAAAVEPAPQALRKPRLALRWAIAAVAAVVVPVVVTIVVMRGEKEKPPSVAPVAEASGPRATSVGMGKPEPRATASGDADAGIDASAAPELKPLKRFPKAPGSSSSAVPAVSVTATANPAPTVSPDLLQ